MSFEFFRKSTESHTWRVCFSILDQGRVCIGVEFKIKVDNLVLKLKEKNRKVRQVYTPRSQRIVYNCFNFVNSAQTLRTLRLTKTYQATSEWMPESGLVAEHNRIGVMTGFKIKLFNSIVIIYDCLGVYCIKTYNIAIHRIDINPVERLINYFC
jgi:hypothetical protein